MIVAYSGEDGSLKTLNVNMSPEFFNGIMENFVQQDVSEYLEVSLKNCLDVKGLKAESIVFPTQTFNQSNDAQYSMKHREARIAKNIISNLQNNYFSTRKYTPVLFRVEFNSLSNFSVLDVVTTSNLHSFMGKYLDMFNVVFVPNNQKWILKANHHHRYARLKEFPQCSFSFKSPTLLTKQDIQAKRAFHNVVMVDEDLCKLSEQRYFIAVLKSGIKGLVLSDALNDLSDRSVLNKVNKTLPETFLKEFGNVRKLEEIQLTTYIEISKYPSFSIRV